MEALPCLVGVRLNTPAEALNPVPHDSTSSSAVYFVPTAHPLLLDLLRFLWPRLTELHLLQVQPASERLTETQNQAFLSRSNLSLPPPGHWHRCTAYPSASCSTHSFTGHVNHQGLQGTHSLTCSLGREMPASICTSSPRPYHIHVHPPTPK